MFDSNVAAQCRLCMQNDDFPIVIFDPNGTDGFLVWKLIMELVDIEISMTDGLPPTICRRCMGRLLEYKKFKKMCINSRIEFLKMQSNDGLVVPVKLEKIDDVDPLDIDFASSANENINLSPGEAEKYRDSEVEKGEKGEYVDPLEINPASTSNRNIGLSPGEIWISRDLEVPIKLEKCDIVDPLEDDYVSTANENLDFTPEERGISRDLEVFIKMEKGNDVDAFEINPASTSNGNIGLSPGERWISRDSEDSNMSGVNSYGESPENEEESHKTVEGNSIGVPRRTMQYAGLQTAKCCGGENSEEEQRTTETAGENDFLMQEGAGEMDTGRKKTKGMKKKENTVQPTCSVAEEEVERKRKMNRDSTRSYYQSMSKEKKREHFRKQNEAKKRRIANMSAEEKSEYRKRQNESDKRRLNRMSEEKKEEHRRRRNERNKKWREQMNEEKKKELVKRMHDNLKRRIDQMSEEEKAAYLAKEREYQRSYRAAQK